MLKAHAATKGGSWLWFAGQTVLLTAGSAEFIVLPFLFAMCDLVLTSLSPGDMGELPRACAHLAAAHEVRGHRQTDRQTPAIGSFQCSAG